MLSGILSIVPSTVSGAMIEELGRGKYRRAPSRKKAGKQEDPAAQAETDNDGGEEQSK